MRSSAASLPPVLSLRVQPFQARAMGSLSHTLCSIPDGTTPSKQECYLYEHRRPYPRHSASFVRPPAVWVGTVLRVMGNCHSAYANASAFSPIRHLPSPPQAVEAILTLPRGAAPRVIARRGSARTAFGRLAPGPPGGLRLTRRGRGLITWGQHGGHRGAWPAVWSPIMHAYRSRAGGGGWSEVQE